MHKSSYSKYINSTTQAGSNKAASYVRALDLLCMMLEVEEFTFQDCKNIWSVDSSDRIHALYECVLLEGRKGVSSTWNIQGIPISYLRDGFCSAALKSYEAFLVEKKYELEMFNIFNFYQGAETDLTKKLNTALNYPEDLFEGLEEKKGKDVIRSVRARINQNVFRKMIMSIYNQSCCITGLNIADINRASHIIRWSDDVEKRLDPRAPLIKSHNFWRYPGTRIKALL